MSDPTLEASAEWSQRCCESHPDWATLSTHLVAAFPQVDPEVVLRHVVAAQEAAELFSMTTAASLESAERMVRHELLVMTGEVQDSARLSPESHRPRE